jgi:hypothetical protein
MPRSWGTRGVASGSSNRSPGSTRSPTRRHGSPCCGLSAIRARNEAGREDRQQRLVAREGIVLFFRARREQPLEPARRAAQHAHDLVVAGWRQREETRRLPVLVGVRIGAVERERVEVEVEVQRRPEALEEGDRAALLGTYAPVAPNAPPQLREERAQERAKHFSRDLGIVCTAVAKWVRKREHPLADRHRGEDAIHEVRCGVGHPAAATGGGRSHGACTRRAQAVVTTVVAMKAQEAVGEDAAAQERSKLLLDEVRRRALARPRARQEGLELLADDAV